MMFSTNSEMYTGVDDMPQAVWRKIGKAKEKLEATQDKKDEKALLRLIYVRPTKVARRSMGKLNDRLRQIEDEHFEEILLDDELELKILKHVDLAILLTENLIEDDGHKRTLFRKLEAELEGDEKTVDTSDKKYTGNKLILTKYMGGGYIDENLYTIREYDAAFKMLHDEIEALKAQRIQHGNN